VVWQPVPQHPGVTHSQPSVSGAVPLLQSDDPALHVYEQVVPLQDAADAWVRVHWFPQAPQLAVLLSLTQEPLQSVPRQVQLPVWQSGDGCAQTAWLCQVPVALQVCGVLAPLQLVCPGAQTPTQAPLTHVWLVHADVLPHAPPAAHACTPLPEHCVCPGAHTPVQTPPTQV
jgi:hypothetical protein